jgi:SAM-dependent methyltransferase
MKQWLTKLSKTRSRQGLYDFLELEYSKIRKSSKVLSIGSGGEVNNLLYKFSQKSGFDVISFDIDAERKPDIIGDICNYDFKGLQFDVVVICEVLEHLHSPQLGIKNVHSTLVPEGKLILTTPFIFPLHDRPYDYYRFTKYGLEYLLSDFKGVQIKERNSFFEAIDVLWMRVLMVNTDESYRLSKVLIPVIYYIKRPFTRLLDKLLVSDAMTTGYNVTAIK